MPLARDRRRPRCAPLAATALVLLGASLAACSAPMRDDADLDGMTSRPAVPLEPAPGFARADADGLSIDGVRFTVASANAFELLQFYAVGDAAGGRAKVQAAGAAGLRMLRVFVTGLADPATARFAPIELWRRDREAFLAAFDAMLADAADAGVHVIPSLITGVLDPTELPSAFGCEDWMSLPLMAGSRNRAAAFDLARDLATRFADDPRVLAWELGNELNYLAAHRKPGVLCASRREVRELVDELSFQIRTIDRHHPIAGGVVQEDAPDRLPIGELPGAFDDVADWFRFYQGVANVDIASTHLYGERTYRDVAGEPLPMSAVLEHLHEVARAMGKPLWLGELGPRPGRTWVDTPYDDDVMSMLLARHHLDLDLVSPWTWQTAYLAPTVYGGQIAFDLDTGHSDAALAVLTSLDARPGLPRSQRWTAIAGDLDGDGRWEVGCVSDGGLVQVAPTGAAGPGAPSQWLSRPAGSPPDAALDAAMPLVGDFDGDGRHDLGFRTRDGRWLVARSTGRRLGALEPWLSGLGDESSDEGLARSQAIAGDFDHHGRADVALVARDGRLWVASSGGAAFAAPRLVSSAFGDERADATLAGATALVGDFDGDGAADLALIAPSGAVVFASGAGGLASSRRLDLGLAGIDAVVAADLDGDGRSDLVLRTADGSARLARSSGDRFEPTRDLSFEGDAAPAGATWTAARVSAGPADQIVERASDGRVWIVSLVASRLHREAWVR